jgi:hypothetical protein
VTYDVCQQEGVWSKTKMKSVDMGGGTESEERKKRFLTLG